MAGQSVDRKAERLADRKAEKTADWRENYLVDLTVDKTG